MKPDDVVSMHWDGKVITLGDIVKVPRRGYATVWSIMIDYNVGNGPPLGIVPFGGHGIGDLEFVQWGRAQVVEFTEQI